MLSVCCSDSDNDTLTNVEADRCSSSAVDCAPSPTGVPLTSSAQVQHRPSLHARGLIDGLSRFFTPSDRRGPRVCRQPQPTPHSHKHHRRTLRTSSLAESKDVAVTMSSSETSPKLHYDTAANTDAKLEDVKVSSSPLPTEQKSTLLQSVREQSELLSIQQTSVNCGTTMRRSREQLTDGLSHFFTAVGKRRRCSAPKQYLYSARRTCITNGVDSNTENNSDDRVSKAAVSFRMKLFPNKRVASVKLKRLPVKMAWELHEPACDSSTERKTKICGKTVNQYFIYIFGFFVSHCVCVHICVVSF